MKAMIFAAGIGSRLRPLTDTTPKALIEVGGKPMISHVIDHIASTGIREIIVNVHHLSAKLKDFLRTHYTGDLKIVISDETDALLDTGGGLVKAANLLGYDNDILLHNADIYTDADLGQMISRHVMTRADATLLTSTRSTSRYLLFDRMDRMTGWTNTLTGEIKSPYPPSEITESRPLAFGGIHIISPATLHRLTQIYPRDLKFSITQFYIDECRSLDIRSFTPIRPYTWIDIGKPESLAKAREIASKR